jgi:hypothetical protein
MSVYGQWQFESQGTSKRKTMKNFLTKNLSSIKNLAFASILVAASFNAQARYVECGGALYGYYLKNGTIYYWWDDFTFSDGKRPDKSIPSADVDTFQPLQDPFASECPSAPSFYGKDKNHVYYQGKIIEGADPTTFYISDRVYTKDKNHAFYGTHLISNRADAFHRAGTNEGSEYATDGENYYFDEIVIKGTDLEIFEPGAYAYARIDNNIYHRGRLIPGVDIKSFIALSPEFEVVKDKNNVFFKEGPINGADAETFVLIRGTDGAFKDRNSVYFNGEKIPYLNSSTVRISENKNYLIGDHSVYAINETGDAPEKIILLKDRDAASFHELESLWTLDKNGVYYKDKLFSVADPFSFHSINYLQSEDKNFRYVNNNIVCKFSSNTLGEFPVCEVSYGKCGAGDNCH